MNLTLTFIILWVGFIFLFTWIDNKYFESDGDRMAAVSIIFTIIWVILAGFTWHIQFQDTEEMHKHHYWIESLGNDKYTEGDFTLGTGNIETVDYYFFFVNTSNGYKRLKSRVDNTYIIETDDRKPELESVTIHYKDEDYFFKTFDGEEDHKVLYVPKGTIIKDFKVR